MQQEPAGYIHDVEFTGAELLTGGVSTLTLTLIWLLCDQSIIMMSEVDLYFVDNYSENQYFVG